MNLQVCGLKIALEYMYIIYRNGLAVIHELGQTLILNQRICGTQPISTRNLLWTHDAVNCCSTRLHKTHLAFISVGRHHYDDVDDDDDGHRHS